MQIECVCLVTQGIKKLKLSPTTISATADKFIKNTRSSVENVEITVINITLVLRFMKATNFIMSKLLKF